MKKILTKYKEKCVSVFFAAAPKKDFWKNKADQYQLVEVDDESFSIEVRDKSRVQVFTFPISQVWEIIEDADDQNNSMHLAIVMCPFPSASRELREMVKLLRSCIDYPTEIAHNDKGRIRTLQVEPKPF
jgi:hypothetical protein